MLRTLRAAPLPVILVVLSFLCPTELSLYVAGLRLPPHRVALLVLVPIALYRILVGRKVRLRAFDIFFLLFNAWTVYAFAQHGEGQEGLVFGGSLAVESFGAYIVARAFVVTDVDFERTLKVLVLAVAAAGIVALPETLLAQHFTHDLLQALTGYAHPRAIETRVGLTRAYGTFDHPIHLGTFCASMLAMVWFATASERLQRKRAMILVGATVLAISSAPILCLALQVGLIVWDRLTRGTHNRTMLTMVLLFGLYLGASTIMTRSPIAFIATGMTLDPWTGYYRLQIWEHGLENVWANAWLGLGLNDWVRPWWMISSTVDAFWLVIAMRAGMPAFVLLAVAIILLMAGTTANAMRARDSRVRRMAMGWMMSLIALSLIACTVHFWNALHAYFFFFLGLAGWMTNPALLRARAKKGSSARRTRPAVLDELPGPHQPWPEPAWPPQPWPQVARSLPPWPPAPPGHGAALGPAGAWR
jgi:hypothetical protein